MALLRSLATRVLYPHGHSGVAAAKHRYARDPATDANFFRLYERLCCALEHGMGNSG